jgi:hypothetical protein
MGRLRHPNKNTAANSRAMLSDMPMALLRKVPSLLGAASRLPAVKIFSDQTRRSSTS